MRYAPYTVGVIPVWVVWMVLIVGAGRASARRGRIISILLDISIVSDVSIMGVRLIGATFLDVMIV